MYSILFARKIISVFLLGSKELTKGRSLGLWLYDWHLCSVTSSMKCQAKGGASPEKFGDFPGKEKNLSR